MSKPVIKSGRFTAGAELQCGENVVVEVAEEVIVGDRVVLPDNTYLGGRRIEIGSDFYGFAWEWGRLDVGRGRIDEEDAVLMVGSRCTFHDNRIDLSRRVIVGNDVGLSPEVVIYTHYYWLSVLEGYPVAFEPVEIGDGVIVGFRSVILPGAQVGRNAVVGAQSVVTGELQPGRVYAGNPAKVVRNITQPSAAEQRRLLLGIMDKYQHSRAYRGVPVIFKIAYPFVELGGCSFNVETFIVMGEENEATDDFRDFTFRRGLRFYTKRPFRRLARGA